jgi:putative spermidine/putrescine transport system ATP-binding protein
MAGSSGAPDRLKLRVDKVTKRYGAVPALLDAELAVRAGECVTLLGPSGSGKTTLLRIVAGLLDPDQGEIWIEDKRATHLPAYRRDIGLVFQSYALFPHLSVFENIAFPLRMRGLDRAQIQARVERALAAVRLEPLHARMPSELSGGQQQRIALARSMVYEPSIVLMDEPLAALDKKLREQLQLELRRVQRELGITMLYVTHDQQEALLLSDRICLMNAGRIEQIGTPADLYFRPATLFAADFIGESNIFDAVVLARGAEARLRGPGGAVLTVRTAAPLAEGQTVTAMIRPERLDLRPLDAADRPADAIAGVVEEKAFLGDDTKYFVRVSDALVMTVKALTRGEHADVPVGTRVALGCAPDGIVILGP